MNTIELGIRISADGSGQVKADITDINSKLSAMGKAGADAGAKNKKAADEMRNGYKYAKDSVESLKKTLLAYISISAAWNGAKQITATADAYTNLTSKLKVVTGTTQEFNRALQDTSQIANQYQQDINSVGAAYNRLAPIVANLGKSQKDVADAISSVSAALRLSGASTSEASETLRQFGQALSGPTVQMEEMNTIIDSASVLWQGLQRQFPELIRQYGSLKEAVGKGALSNKDLLEATIRLRKEFDAQASTMQTTVSGALRVLSNEWEKYIGNTDQAEGTSKKLADTILKIAVNLDKILTPLATFTSAITDVMIRVGATFDFISEKFKTMQGWFATAREYLNIQSNTPLFDATTGRPINPNSQYTTGGGFGGEMPSSNAGTPRFDGINRSITTMGDAADKAGTKVKKMKADMEEGIDALARKWRLNSDQIAMAMRVYQEAQRIGVDPNFAVGLSYFESGLKNRGPNAAGARGPMQVIPGTFNRLKRDYPDIEGPNSDALSNIRAGLHYIKEMAREFGSYKLAAAGYLAGEGSVRKARGMPHKVDRYTGVTTEQYADRVMRNAGTVASLLGGSDLSGWEKTLEDEQKRAYDLFADRIDRQSKLADMNRAKELEKQKIALQQLGNEYNQWEQKNQLDIRFAVDQKSYEEQIQLINDAQTKAEEYIREMNRTAGGEDTARVQAINDEIKAIDRKIAKVKETTKDEQEIAKLQDEKKLKQVEREKEVIAAQSGNLDLQKALAENTVKYDAMREEAGRRIVELQTQQADIAQRLGGLTAEAAKDIIDSQTEQLRSQVQINAAQREAAINNNQDLTTIDKQREAIKGRLVDTIAVVEAEARAAQEKLAIDQGMLAYEEEILRVRLAGTKSIQDRLAIEAQLAENTLKQAAARKAAADIEVAAAGKIAKAQADATNDDRNLVNQNVQEQQLRLNAFWDQYMQRLNDYSSLWQEITGETQDGFSKMAIAMGEYAKQSEQIGQYFKQNPMAFGDMTGAVEGLQQGQAALAAMAKTMLALRTQYKEGTQGYKDMTSAAERMMEIQRALQLVEGVLAVIHQATSGDPYTAIPRMLGVAAMIASMGVNTGAAGGAGGSVSNSRAREMSQSGGYSAAGGGVFGDASAQSDSIAKSLEIVSANSSADLAYSAGMLRSLKNIELSLAGTTNAIIRGVGPTAVSGLGSRSLDQMINPLNGISDPLTKALHKLVFNVSTKITDWGIKSLPQSLDQVIARGFTGMNWTEVTKTTKVLGITIGKSVKNFYTALDTGVAGQITRVIRSMADTVREAGKAFGISGEQFMSAMKGFTVNFGTLSTKGLKGDELEKAVQQVFSSMSDDMAQAFQSRFDLGLEPFMQAGEGMFQTLVRVADGINVASGMLAQAGLQAINYQEIVYKQGDIAAEIVRQSIVAFEGVNTAIGAYVDQAVGSAEELMEVYRDLLIVGDTAKLVGFNMRDLTDALIVTSGGVAKFLENLTVFNTEIFGISHYVTQMVTLRREFAKLNMAVPKDNRSFTLMLKSIDTTTEAGQKLYAQMLALAGAFAKAQQEAQKLQELREKYLPTDSMAGYRKQIEQVKKDFRDIIEGTLAALPGGEDYIRRTRNLEMLTETITQRQIKRSDKQAQLDLVQAEIDALKAKSVLTKEEKKRLAELRQRKGVLQDVINSISADISGYQKSIDAINKAIKNDPNNKNLLKERAKLLEEQGDAIIKTLSDIWDAMTQAITAARETLKSINDSIFELIGGTGSENMKLGMATARRVIAEGDYTRYTQNGGTDIVQLQKYADAYYRAIIEERDAKIAAIEAPMKALEKERDIRQKAHDAEIAALEKQLGIAKELFDAVKGIQEYAKSLRTSAAANLSPRRQLEASKAAYEELRAKAAAGDVEAMRKITGASDTYLDAAKKYFGTGGKYGVIFDSIVADMDKLGMRDMGDAQSIQDKIDQLNEAHGKYLDSIDKQIAALNIEEQIKAENDKTAQRLKDLAKDLGPRIEQAEAQAKKDMADLIAEVGKTNGWSEKQLAALNTMLKSWGMKPIDPGKKPDETGEKKPDQPGGSKPPKPMKPADDPDQYDGPSAYKTWNKYWKQALLWWKNHFKDSFTWKDYKIKTAADLMKQGMHPIMPAFANGGFAQPGWALVGEEGPELVKFGSQAMVYDAEATARMLREMASFQPVMPEAPRPINLAPMPRLIDDLPKQGKPIKMAPMPRVIDDIPRRDPDVNWLSNDKVIAELRAMRTELKALVTTQSRANPAVIEQLANIERRLGYMERDQKLKPA